MGERKKNIMTDYEMNTKAKMIEETFSYDTYEVTRLEVFAHTRAAQITIRPEGISFNQACINSFEDTTHIQILVSQDQKRIAIRKSEEGDKDAIRWCTAKSKTKLITGRKFSEMVYELMGWDAGSRYKAVGYKISYQGEELFVFELSEAEMYKLPPKRTKEEKEQMEKAMTPEQIAAQKKEEARESRIAYSPEQFNGHFGVPESEHQDKVQLQSFAGYTSGADLIREKDPQEAQSEESLNREPEMAGV